MGVEAGWLADPMGAHQHRYWDGSAWTEHVADAGTAGVEPAAGRRRGAAPAGARTDDATPAADRC